MAWWHFLAAVLAMLMCALEWKKRKFNRMSTFLKIEMTEIPIIGHGHVLLGNSEVRMTTFQELGRQAIRQGGVASAWMVHIYYIVVADPEVAEIILKTCLEKGYVTKLMRYVLGNGSIFAPVTIDWSRQRRVSTVLPWSDWTRKAEDNKYCGAAWESPLFSSGRRQVDVPIWRPRRKIVAPTFSQKNLSQFVKIFSKQSRVMVEQLRSAAGKGPFSVWSYFTTYTMDSVCESTLGVQVKSQKNPDQPFLKAFDDFSRLMTSRMCQPWLYSDTVYKMLPAYKKLTKAKEFMCTFIEQIIRAQRKSFKDEQTVKEKNDDPTQETTQKEKLRTFLELLIESSGGDKGCTNLELQEETMVMVMAGTDTSAVGAAFTAVMLSKHPDVQEKIFEELKEVFGDSSRPVVNDDLPRLKYLDAVIRETLRLYPPVPFTVRLIDKDVTLPSGQTILAGTNALINMWAIHRNPLYWGPDAEEFRPERFLNPEFKHPAQFMPFSYGPRNCLGYQYAMMSMKTAMSNLLRHYRVLPLASNGDSESGRHQPLRVRFDIMMKDADNFIIELEPRV